MTLAAFFSRWPEWLDEVLPGLVVSLKLTGVVIAVGFPLGFAFAVMVLSQTTLVRWLGVAVVEFARGTPLLVMLYLVYFALPQYGLILEPFTAAVVAIGINAAAYSSEIFRGGLTGVPRTQREAAMAIGLRTWKQYRLVVLPQALRLVTPPLIGFSILVFQGTALAFAIGVPELLSRAYTIGTVTFELYEAILLAAVIYAAVAIPISQIVAQMERRSLAHL